MKRIIAVDFDGTLCEDCYPLIGKPNTPLFEYLFECRAMGDRIILWTCRTGQYLEEAIKWCEEEMGFIFDAVNENLPEVIEKFGGDTRKVVADEYIDDKNSSFIFCSFEKEKQND